MKTEAPFFLLALGFAACAEDPPPCYAGEYAACTCAGGASGYAACQLQTAGYGRCVCDGTTPGLDASVARSLPDAGSDAPVGDPKRAVFEPCETNDQCASAVCFAYGDGRALCTKTCASPAECSEPSRGCNGMGVCTPP